jgi:antitoxin CptB
MLELDLLLEPFVLQRYAQLDAHSQAIYRRLIDCEDQQLFDWFLKKQPVPDTELAAMVSSIQLFQREQKSPG